MSPHDRIRRARSAQSIAAFSFVDIPVPADAPGPGRPESDVRTNAAPFDGRVYLLVLDDLHTTSLYTEYAKRAARLFIERHFTDDDLMMVAFSSGRPDAGANFTNSRRVLLEAVSRFWGRSVPGLGPIVTLEGAQRDAPAALAMEATTNRRRLTSLIEQLANWSGGMLPGRRKSLILVSEGIGVTFNCDGQGRNRGEENLDDVCRALNAASRSSVAVFPVDPRGLDPDLSMGAEAAGGSQQRPFEVRQVASGQAMLRDMADATGGIAVVGTNRFDEAYRDIVRDSSSYYVLGYVSPDRRAGRAHTIDVAVSSPGLTVRARRSYVAASGRAEEPRFDARLGPREVQTALNDPLPRSDLPLAITAVPFRGTRGNASVVRTSSEPARCRTDSGSRVRPR